MKPAHEDRAYQKEIEEAIFNHWFEHSTNCIAAAPGGTGKSFVMARIVKRLVVEYPGTRVMVLAQDGKLITQNSAELLRYWPQAPIGIYSSGLKQRDTKQTVIFAGIQSVYKKAKEFGERHIFLIDECDLLSPAEETMYQRFYNEARDINPNLLMAGLTATPYRLKEGCLTNLDIWDKVVIDLTKTERFNWFLDNNFLKPLVTKNPGVEIDVQNISIKGKDFDEVELAEACSSDELMNAIVDRCIAMAHNRDHWLGFVSSIENGHKMAKIFRSRGISAVMLSSKDSIEHRDIEEAKFRSGETRVLLNLNLYIRGWDFPALDFIFWATATQSVAKWVQGNLRGTRTFQGTPNCLVADFGGNIRRLGAVNNPVIPKSRRKGDAVVGEAPLKECPECYSYVPIQCKKCPDCQYEFPPPKTIQKTASTDSILASSEPCIEEFPVLGVKYRTKIAKKTGEEFFSADYNVGLATYRKPMFFAHFNHTRNTQWWTYHGGQLPAPENAETALERAHRELRIPSLIRVDVNRKWPEIVGSEFEEQKLEPFNPEKCTCQHPPFITPCGYCESGDYEPF